MARRIPVPVYRRAVPEGGGYSDLIRFSAGIKWFRPPSSPKATHTFTLFTKVIHVYYSHLRLEEMGKVVLTSRRLENLSIRHVSQDEV